MRMNRHAEKLAKPDAVDPDLGGILEEVYACPKCGKTAIRQAT